MLYVDGVVGLVLLVVWVYALFDVITTRDTGIRNLPKWAWVLIVLLLGPELLCAGAVLWFTAGRPAGPARSGAAGRAGGRTGPARSVPSEYDRPGRATASNPDDDAAFLADLKARAEEQRRRADDERRRREGLDPA